MSFTISGWVFDVYPQSDKMIFWIKQKNGDTVRIEDHWTPSIYIAASDKSYLLAILKDREICALIKDYNFVDTYEKITDNKKSNLLKLDLADSTKVLSVAKMIESMGNFADYRLYNVDLLPAQSYFYEHGNFPLSYCTIYSDGSRLKWMVHDSIWATDYILPKFKIVSLDIEIEKKETNIPTITNRIRSITLSFEKEKLEICMQSEQDILMTLQSEVTRLDPDFIFTRTGDSFLFPYLVSRAEKNNLNLVLGREKDAPLRKPRKSGTSYFSYGKVHFKPATINLLGRIHIDTCNSFIFDVAGLVGLCEVSRLCMIPLHTAARASIGKCMSGIQFYNATKQNLLIPWKPVVAEHFKTYGELLIADRGGFIFEPEIGVHEKVAEFDFSSLYPNIMMKKNLSAETVKCACCLDSKTRVPDIEYNICEKQKGLVPLSLKILLAKRVKYKQLKRSAPTKELKFLYDARQNSLKWILVTSFGYLGFNNSKFGRIDAHIAVCAFDRHLLLKPARISEELGFKVLHGIVDSLWVQKTNATKSCYLELKNAIEKQTGFEISFEGVYKWIAFVSSKESHLLSVANRYFGVFEDGVIKVRGMESRRHDIPQLFQRFQREILNIIATGNDIKQVKSLMPKVFDVFREYDMQLKKYVVLPADLIFIKQLSKTTNAYNINTINTDALRQLEDYGINMQAGEILRYLVTDYYQKRSKKRSIPLELIDNVDIEGGVMYDVERYVELLVETCNSIIEPFGHLIDSDKKKYRMISLNIY